MKYYYDIFFLYFQNIYYIKSDNKDILFIESGVLTPVINYIVQDKEPTKKWIELKGLTGEYSFVDKIGDDAKSFPTK